MVPASPVQATFVQATFVQATFVKTLCVKAMFVKTWVLLPGGVCRLVHPTRVAPKVRGVEHRKALNEPRG